MHILIYVTSSTLSLRMPARICSYKMAYSHCKFMSCWTGTGRVELTFGRRETCERDLHLMLFCSDLGNRQEVVFWVLSLVSWKKPSSWHTHIQTEREREKEAGRGRGWGWGVGSLLQPQKSELMESSVNFELMTWRWRAKLFHAW